MSAANNRVEFDHARLEARPRSMPGAETTPIGGRRRRRPRSRLNVRRGHCEFAVDVNEQCRVGAAFEELMIAV
jgi:hypothetical protein